MAALVILTISMMISRSDVYLADPLRPRVVRDAFPEHFHVDGKVSCGGVELVVSEELLNGADVATVLEEVGRHRGAQEVRVVGLPWPVAADSLEPVVALGEPEGLSCVEIDAAPDGPGGGEWSACVGDEKGVRFAWPGLSAYADPAFEQAYHLFADWEQPVLTTFATFNQNGAVWKDRANLKGDELAGSKPGFIKQPHHDVVSESRQRCQVRGHEQLSHLPLGKASGDPCWGAVGAGDLFGDVVVDNLHLQRPAIERPNSREFHVEGGDTHNGAPHLHPTMNGGFVW